MKIYDVRSDTFTLPSKEMRKAMAEAEVGDDVYGEDPTVNRLEAMTSEMLGKEAALFVSSGSMGNLIPLYLNGGRGQEVIGALESHFIQHEVGAVSSIAGALPIGLSTEKGLLEASLIEPHIKPIAYDLARTAMIEVENSIGGICYPLEQLRQIRLLADNYSLLIHMDGARLWNASVATGVSLTDYASLCDTVTVCLSKGLGAPVGSLLCGSKEFIEQARRVRKILGGGMRQAGILAAAGLYALKHNIERLEEDHQGARIIADALKECGWATFDLNDVQTNMVFFSVDGCKASVVERVLKSHNILVSSSGQRIRMVSCLNQREEDYEQIAKILLSIEVSEFTG